MFNVQHRGEFEFLSEEVIELAPDVAGRVHLSESDPGQQEDKLMEEQGRLAHLWIALGALVDKLCLVEGHHFVVFEVFVLVARDRGDCRLQVELHILNVKHERDHALVSGHLHEATRDHWNVLLFDVFPVKKLKMRY